MTSVILIIGVAVAVATCASAKKTEQTKNNSVNFQGYSEEDIDMLRALRFDGYEDMSVSEYRQKVWELTDTVSYHALLECFSQNNTLYEKRTVMNWQISCFIFWNH